MGGDHIDDQVSPEVMSEVPSPEDRPDTPWWTTRGFWLGLCLVLLVTVVGIVLSRVGLTPLSTTAALLVVGAVFVTGLRVSRGHEPVPATTVTDDPARRAVLTGTALTTAAAVGEALRRRDPAQQVAEPELTLTDYAELAVDRRDPNDPSSWDWTPALRAALDAAASRANRSQRLKGSEESRHTGLPGIRIPRGSYRLSDGVALRYLHGLTVAGDGRQVSVLVFEGDSALFDVHRSSALVFSGLTIIGRDPEVEEGVDVQGMREGSCAFRFTETAADDNQGGGNATMFTFAGMEVNEMHRAFVFAGHQMVDGMVWNDLRLRDNFVDFDYANGNAVNHQVFGSEILYGVSFPEQSYAERLGAWASRPDLRDGAVVNASTGGDLAFFGGSVIARKPTLAFARPPQDASQGAISNVAGYSFFATRWELRERDATGDQAGLQRSTLIRWRVPVPADRSVQPTVRFDACRFVVLVDDVDLLYLANAAAISWDGCRVFPPTRARVVSLVGPETARLPGTFMSEGSTTIPVVRRLMAATDDGVDHVIEVSARGAPDVGQGSSPVGYSTVVAGRPNTARRVLHRHPAGHLLAQGQRVLDVQLRVPPGALVKQVGVVLLGPPGEDVSVSISADDRQLAELVAGPVDAKPSLVVEEFVESGFLRVTASRAGVLPVQGYVYAEYF